MGVELRDENMRQKKKKGRKSDRLARGQGKPFFFSRSEPDPESVARPSLGRGQLSGSSK
jgi:hypothetical protein